MKWKRCPMCGLWLPPECFYPIDGRHDGLDSYCRVCRCKHEREKRLADHDETIAYETYVRALGYPGYRGLFTGEEWSELKCCCDYRCLRCGKREPFIVLVPDHIRALSIGGSNYIWNIQTLCTICNLIKGRKEIDYSKGPLPAWDTLLSVA